VEVMPSSSADKNFMAPAHSYISAFVTMIERPTENVLGHTRALIESEDVAGSDIKEVLMEFGGNDDRI
jgi:hypothetical protein